MPASTRIIALAVALCWAAAAQSPSLEIFTWQSHTPPAADVRCFQPHPADETLWFVCATNGLHISRDSGATYRRVFDDFIVNVGIDPNNTNRIVAVCLRRCVHVSEDRGLNWVRREITQEDMHSILISPRDGAIYVGPRNTVANHGVYKSVDQGRTFTFGPYKTTSANLITWALG